jgi:hypothetical protein
VIAFNAQAASEDNGPDSAIFPPGMVRACVSPSSFGANPEAFAALTYSRSSPNSQVLVPEGVETEWVGYANIYEGECSAVTHRIEVDVATGYPGAVPLTPQELQERIGANSLHWAEPFITNADLVRIVETQSTNR